MLAVTNNDPRHADYVTDYPNLTVDTDHPQDETNICPICGERSNVIYQFEDAGVER